MHTYGVLYILIICFIAISTVGFIINIVSISYFIRNEKRGLANIMMICLNLTDILSNFASIIFNSCYVGLPCILILVEIFYYDLNAFAISSGCVTFAITQLRTMTIYRPFYHIRKRIFVGILVLVTFMMIVLIGVLYLRTSYVPFQLCGVAAVILSCFNIAMSAAVIIVLRKPEIEGVEYHRQERNYAVVTMVIILISFIYFATSFPILLVLVVFPGLPLYQQTYAGEIYLMMLSLSSLLNPLVYIFRKQQIQTYIKECLRKLLYCCYRGC